MSRITAIGFVMLDAVLNIATIAQSTLTLAVVILTLLGSIGIAIVSGSVRSILWPSHFWDDAGLRRNVIKR